GVDNGQDKYAFTVTPIANGVKLPPLPAIQITHSKTGGIFGTNVGAGDQVAIDTLGVIYSPWVPIDPGSKVNITAQHIGSKAANFTLLTDAANLAGNFATAGGWAI